MPPFAALDRSFYRVSLCPIRKQDEPVGKVLMDISADERIHLMPPRGDISDVLLIHPQRSGPT
jgi:hypothetical protein